MTTNFPPFPVKEISSIPPAPPPPLQGWSQQPADSPPAAGSADTVKRHTRLNPDSIVALIIAVVLVFGLILASFIASFAAIYEVSEYTGVGWWRWVFPVFIDMAILAYTISLFIFRARKRPIKMTVLGLLLFASLSIAANVAHVVAYWETQMAIGESLDYRAWVGVALAASAPIGVLMASEEIARLAFVDPEDRNE